MVNTTGLAMEEVFKMLVNVNSTELLGGLQPMELSSLCAI